MSGRTPDSTIETAIQALVTLCFEDLMTGDWDELLDVADDALRLCESHGYSELRWPLWLASGSVAAARGQLPWAHELADRIERWGAVRGSADVQLYARLVRCQAAQASGDFDRAFREISVLGTASVFSAHLPLSLWASLDYVSCALRARRRDAAEAFVALTATVDPAVLTPRLQLLTSCAASITTLAARTDRVLEAFLAAPDMERWRFDVARVELAYGERLRRGRTVAEARRHISRASALFGEVQASPWQRRARQELRASGGLRERTDGAQGTALTPQEREIAELAARGLTNRQIAAQIYLSPRTVAAHLYRMFPKLGISSRAALRDALSGTEPVLIEEAPEVDHATENECRPGVPLRSVSA